MSWAYHQPLHKLFYLENNSTLRVLKKNCQTKFMALPGAFFLFPIAGIPGGTPPWPRAVFGPVWQRLCAARCGGNGRVFRIEPLTLEVCGEKISRKSSFNNEFHPGVSSRDLFGVIRDPFTQVGKLTSNVDRIDHDLNHLDNGVIFRICCTKTNGVAARFFGKTFLNGSGCQCWNM